MGDGQAMQDTSYDRKPGAIVLAGDLANARLAAEAVELAGARAVRRLGWAEAAELRDYGTIDLLMIDANGVPDTVLEPALPIIEDVAHDTGARIVVVLDVGQINLIARHLFGRQVQLLCAPTVTELVAALSIAAAIRLDGQVNEGRDAEAARLRRLNEEVARIAETLARLTRGDTPPPERPALGVGDRTLGYGAPPSDERAADLTVTPHDLRQAIRARRLRTQFFDQGLFEDPAWDMLLDLYAAEMERAQVSVSSLCIAAAVAPTTALRWIAKMSEAGLFERHPDPFDRRRAFMALSDKASDGMRAYCAATRRAGLGIA